VVRVRRIGIALLRLLEDRERRIEATEFESRASAQHQRGEVLVGVDIDTLEHGEHADWIAHYQRGAREQNSKLVALGVTQDSRFEHPKRVRGFASPHHQRRYFSEFFGCLRACVLQSGARVAQRAHIPTRNRITQGLAGGLQLI